MIFGSELKTLKHHFSNPPERYWPRIRWGWSGSAVTKEEITWELNQMHDQGIGGVEIFGGRRSYQKGSMAYLSDEWVEMVKHTIETAKKLKMSVCLMFGPGYPFGGFWVKQADRSQSLGTSSVEVEGPGVFNQMIPEYRFQSVLPAAAIDMGLSPDTSLVAVVAAGGVLWLERAARS